MFSADLAVEWDNDSSVQDRTAQRLAAAMMEPQFDVEAHQRRHARTADHTYGRRFLGRESKPTPMIPWQAGWKCQVCGAHVVTTGLQNRCTAHASHKIVPPSQRGQNWQRCGRCGRYTEDTIRCCPPLRHYCQACGGRVVGRQLLCNACGGDWPVEADE
ncbi:MAG: hypothetical protein PHU75_03750 [Candidatus Nanopelagicales bacterium]|nr:hypothetical protein [Candidatus Nanopelagicales bacterium]